MTMTNILFISGFNTHPSDNDNIDIYSVVDIYFKFSESKVTFFRYKTSDDLGAVYKSLVSILATREHDLIITHSMGSCLYLKYLSETVDLRKVIICMPFIKVSQSVKLLTLVPLVKYMYLPKFCLIPNHNLYEGGNVFNDTTKLVCCRQIYHAISNMFLSDEEIVRIVNSHPSLRIIYAENETVSPIDDALLSRISDHVSMTKGKHLSFANAVYMSDFFNVLTSEMKKME